VHKSLDLNVKKRYSCYYIYQLFILIYSFKNQFLYNIIKHKNHFLVPEPPEHQQYKEKLIFNGIFAFSPYHHFVKGYITYMYNNYKHPNNSQDVLKTTGPAALGNYYTKHYYNLKLDNYCLVSPYTRFQKKCKECFDPNSSYIYTKWNEGSGWWEYKNNNNFNFIIFIPILLSISFLLHIRYRRHRIIS